MSTERDSMRCPVCGDGVLADISYDHPDRAAEPSRNDGDSYEVFAFTCGHETRGGALATSGHDVIDVERRNVERMVIPPEGGEGGE
jgi:hypothetical protein